MAIFVRLFSFYFLGLLVICVLVSIYRIMAVIHVYCLYESQKFFLNTKYGDIFPHNTSLCCMYFRIL